MVVALSILGPDLCLAHAVRGRSSYLFHVSLAVLVFFSRCSLAGGGAWRCLSCLNTHPPLFVALSFLGSCSWRTQHRALLPFFDVFAKNILTFSRWRRWADDSWISSHPWLWRSHSWALTNHRTRRLPNLVTFVLVLRASMATGSTHTSLRLKPLSK